MTLLRSFFITLLIPSVGFSVALDLQGTAYNASNVAYTYTVIKPPTGVSACLIYNAATNRMDAVEFDGSMHYDSFTDRVGVSTATFDLLKGYAEQVATEAGDAAVIEAEGVESRMTSLVETQISSLSSGTASAIAALPTVAHTGAYSDLTGKPALFSGDFLDLANKPVIPNAQVKADWNASGTIAEILNKPTIPTNTNQLTNGAGFLTGVTSGQVTTALGFTPYNATNPSAYINQAGARTAISLTTTGTGAASYNSTTGLVNIPTIGAATTSTAGTLSAVDKAKLDTIASEQTKIITVSGGAGRATWTFTTPYGAGVVPIVIPSVVKATGVASSYNVQTYGDPTNTSVTVEVQVVNNTITGLLGLIGITSPAPDGTKIHLVAKAPTP